MNKTYGNASAAEIAKYHIAPDVIARWPEIDDLQNAIDTLIDDAAELEVSI